jgi:hypothetical protein
MFFGSTILEDCLDRANVMHVVRSYINEWILEEVQNFLFFCIYYYFPIYIYFPDYIQKFVSKMYFWTKQFLTRPTAKDDGYYTANLPPVTELDLYVNFLKPFFFDKKLPWIDFTKVIIYKIKPFTLSFLDNFYFFSGLEKIKLSKKADSLDFPVDTFQHSILSWLALNDYFTFTREFLDFSSENFLLRDHFWWRYYSYFLEHLSKIWKFSNFYFFLQRKSTLSSLQRKSTLSSLQRKSTLNNDINFFWSFNKEFNLNPRFTKVKKKWGRPKKKEQFYFDSEKEIFEKLEKLKFWWNQSILLLRSKQKLWLNPPAWNLQIVNLLLLNLKKPF